MRYLAVITIVISCFVDVREKATAAENEVAQKATTAENVNSAYYKYNMRVHKMLQDEVKPIFTAQAHRLEVDYEFYLNPQGHIVSINTHAKAGGQWAEQTIADSIHALKFPPVPPQVFEEIQEEPFLRIYGTMSWDPQPSADQDIGAAGKEGVEAMFRAEAPYIAKGRATYPEAKARYLAGLPPGYRFAVRKHLTEPGTHHSDGVYIDVEAIKEGKIYGRLGDVDLPSFRRGQRISFPESELEDWAIVHPDGSIEGDFVGKFLERARSPTNDLVLSSDDISKMKRVCRQFIGLPFQDASHWMELAPFIRTESELYQPVTTCAGEYCSGGLRLRDDTQFLYTYLHTTPANKRDNGDVTPDLGRKGNNRIVGVSLIRHGKTILSEGHLDRNTVDLYLWHRDSRKSG